MLDVIEDNLVKRLNDTSIPLTSDDLLKENWCTRLFVYDSAYGDFW
jgi:hypothetical protein